MNDYLSELENELYRARKYPWKLFADVVRYRVMKAVSKLSFLSEKTAKRFERSAKKRDPARGFKRNEDQPLPQTPQPTLSVTDQPLAAELSLTREERAAVAMRADRFAVLKGGSPYRPDRDTVLVVSHETNLSGAPVLAYNVAEELSKTCNVVVLALEMGNILKDFRAVATEVLLTNRYRAPSDVYEAMVRHAAGRRPSFAIVNSVESRPVLKHLKKEGIRSVALIHEFASYTPDRERAFAEFAECCAATVFSSPLTLENALDLGVMQSSDALHVIPQGRCRIPGTGDTGGIDDTARAALRRKLRPEGAEDRFLVLGAGSVELRKGLDLFTECANRLTREPDGEKYDFVWFGSGFTPGDGYGYSVFLADQIRRSGLEGRVRILPPTSEIETAYETADVFLLPSRLDPLPNVTIDALSVGLPIVCFEKANGMAPILQKAGLGPASVARFLDPGDMAAKVRKLAGNSEYYADVRRRGLAAAQDAFALDKYVARIATIARGGETLPSPEGIAAERPDTEPAR